MTLNLENVNSFYGSVQILRDLTLSVDEGTVLCLLGRNGAGKTTILKSIMGLVAHTGQITMSGESLSDLAAHEIPRLGIGYVPQGRRLFAELTVAENLQIGLMARTAGARGLESVFGLFPVLKARLKQPSGTLSGGEQQMLAMARALCLQPKFLLLDEPTEGLQPSMVARVREVILTLCSQGVGILLVEQRVDAVLPVADKVAFVENGSITTVMRHDQKAEIPALLKRYVSI